MTLLMVSPSARGRDPGTERKRPNIFLGLPRWRMRPVSPLPTDSTKAASSGAPIGHAARASARCLRRRRRLHPAPTPSPGAGTLLPTGRRADHEAPQWPPTAPASARTPPHRRPHRRACRVLPAGPTHWPRCAQPSGPVGSGPRRTRLPFSGFARIGPFCLLRTVTGGAWNEAD